MREQQPPLEFRSLLGPQIREFIREKQASGYRYSGEIWLLRRLDRFLCEQRASGLELAKPVVDRWTARQPHESPTTQQIRISLVRQFALFLRRRGIAAHVPDGRLAPRRKLDFVPHIFSHREVANLIRAADGLSPDSRAPLRHLVMPEVFRLLYGCGMRVSEVLRLKVADVDLAEGILLVREGKFKKDRLVPLASSLTERIRRYASDRGPRTSDDFFFPAPDRGRYSISGVYGVFRRLLWECGIPHGGRGRGPRVHDLRHTFAVHRLEAWYRSGEDLGAKLPVLAVYMGHQTLSGTQRYLRLTPEIFPDIITRLDAATGNVIPSGPSGETD